MRRREADRIDAARARSLVLKWLTRREHGSRELHGKLLRKGCAEALAVQVIERLRTEGLVSDERFVEALIASRRRRGVGPLRILKELQEKGVEGETIARFLDVSASEWLEEVRRVRAKKFGPRLPKSLTERARQARFLLSRGFTDDQIRRALDGREA